MLQTPELSPEQQYQALSRIDPSFLAQELVSPDPLSTASLDAFRQLVWHGAEPGEVSFEALLDDFLSLTPEERTSIRVFRGTDFPNLGEDWTFDIRTALPSVLRPYGGNRYQYRDYPTLLTTTMEELMQSVQSLAGSETFTKSMTPVLSAFKAVFPGKGVMWHYLKIDTQMLKQNGCLPKIDQYRVVQSDVDALYQR